MRWQDARAGLALRRFSFGVLLLVAGIPESPAAGDDFAGPLQDAQAALASGDHAKAYPLYLRQAEATRNPLAQFTIGLFHEFGWGRPVDRRAACHWYEQAAEGKLPAAEHFTAECLRLGVHRDADAASAVRWYERAAAHGHALSLCSLGEMYVAGEGVAKDPRKGIALCHDAARQGLKPAQVRLARFFLDGVAGAPDYAAAFQVLEVAAGSDYPEAQELLGRMYRDGLGRNPDPAQALGWFERAASHGHLPAYLPTARLYRAMPRDPQTGLLPPAALAKSYLWSAAYLRREARADERDRAGALLAEILAEMPASWRTDLDRKVEQHLAGLGRTVDPTAGPPH
jgi:TPR repeat protein